MNCNAFLGNSVESTFFKPSAEFLQVHLKKFEYREEVWFFLSEISESETHIYIDSIYVD